MTNDQPAASSPVADSAPRCAYEGCGLLESDEDVHFTEAEKRFGAVGKHLFLWPCMECGGASGEEQHYGYALPTAAEEGRHRFVPRTEPPAPPSSMQGEEGRLAEIRKWQHGRLSREFMLEQYGAASYIFHDFEDVPWLLAYIDRRAEERAAAETLVAEVVNAARAVDHSQYGPARGREHFEVTIKRLHEALALLSASPTEAGE